MPLGFPQSLQPTSDGQNRNLRLESRMQMEIIDFEPKTCNDCGNILTINAVKIYFDHAGITIHLCPTCVGVLTSELEYN